MTEFKLLGLNFQLGQAFWLAVFWTISVLLAYNIAYALYILDQKRPAVSRAKRLMIFMLGSLVVVGTYADTLAAKAFALKDCLLLALVFAHGWMAEELVESFLKRVQAQDK